MWQRHDDPMSRRTVAAAVLTMGALATTSVAAAASSPPSSPAPGSEPAVSSAPAREPTATSAPASEPVVASSAPGSEPPASDTPGTAAATQLRFIGEVDISNLTSVGGTLVGGLSGLDYDEGRHAWVVLSDDRSDFNPARFYDASLTYSDTEFTEAQIIASHPLLRADGTTYPNSTSGGDIPDPESIRVDPVDGSLWWTSEGNQELGLDPLLIHANPRGVAVETFEVPETFGANPEDAALGARNNKAFEGLTFSADGESLFAIMEGPLYQDAELPTLEAGSVTRIVQFDRDGNVVAQYAYPLDALPAAGEGESAALADNGATEILAIDDTRMLVIERAGIPRDGAPWEMYVRLYEIDLSVATDVSDLDALAGAAYTPVAKSLVLDFHSAGLEHVDNLEGMTFGPALPNGSQSLVIVSDNNFDAAAVTQLLVYEVLPAT